MSKSDRLNNSKALYTMITITKVEFYWDQGLIIIILTAHPGKRRTYEKIYLVYHC
jgi:hypothetical protein